MAKQRRFVAGVRRLVCGSMAPILTAGVMAVTATITTALIGAAPAQAAVPNPAEPPTTITLTSSASDLQVGQTATLTTTTDVDIAPTNSVVHIVDQTTSSTIATCATGTTCTAAVSFSTGGPRTYVATVNALTSNTVTVDRAGWGISLTEDTPVFAAGKSVTLTATTNQDIDSTGGNYAIYVFDETAGTLLGHCDSSNSNSPTTTCTATSTFSTGEAHTYVAEVAAAANPLPASLSDATDAQATSNQVSASRQPWTIQLATDQTSYAAGQTATLTATVDQNLDSTNGSYALYVFDQGTGQPLAYCTTGSTCTATGTYDASSPITYVAEVAHAGGPSTTLGQLTDVQASSNAVTVQDTTWTVALTTSASTFPAGDYATLTATANSTMGASGNAVYIIDRTTDAVIKTEPNNGQTSVQVSFQSGGPHTYVAEVAHDSGTSVTPEQLTGVEATSEPVTVSRQAWTIGLASNESTFAVGDPAKLTATTNQDVGATHSYAEYIFDLATGAVVAYCGNAYEQCSNNNETGQPANFLSGGPHDYIAVVAADAGSSITYAQASDIQATSNIIQLAREAWTLALTEANNASYQTVITATANQDAGLSYGTYDILIIDATSDAVLTAQSQSWIAQTRFDFTSSIREVYAVVAQYDSATGTYSDIQAVSNSVTAPNPPPNLSISELLGGSNPAENGCSACHGDPVSTDTGEFVNTAADLGIPGVGPGLLVNRTYSSAVASTDSPFGYGWSFNYSTHLTFSGGNQTDPLPRAVTVTQENQSTVGFLENPNQHYVAPPRVLATLAYDSASDRWTFTRRSKQILVFDSSGRLIKLRDPNGNSVDLSYDDSGELVTASASGGRTITLGWTDGHITSATDSAGQSVSYTYDAAGNLGTITAADGGVTTYGYDSAHRLTTLTTPRGAVTTNTYDSSGRVSSQTDPDKRTTTFSYSGSFPNYTTTTTAPDNSKTVESYSGGRLISRTLGSGTSAAATWSYTYDVEDDVASVTDPTGAVESFTYDSSGNRLAATDPLGDESSWTYDSLGDVLTATDGAGRTTTNTYDADGNLLTVTSPLGHKQTFTYNPDGTKASATDALGYTTTYTYDPTGDLTSTTDPDARTTSYAYNAAGDITTATDSAGKQTTYSYDAANRLLSVTDPTNHTTSYTYDADGHRTTVKDALGRITTYTYDMAGQHTATVDPARDSTTYTYTGAGQVATVTDADNHTTTYTYDARGDKTSVTDADNRTTTYLYDGDGRLLSTTSPSGAVTQTSYNAAGQATTTTDARGNITKYTYTRAGQLASTTDPLGRITTKTYNLDGRLTTTTYPDTTKAIYGYNVRGDLTSYTNPDGLKTTYGYDKADLNVSRTAPGTSITRYSYDSAGRLHGTTWPSGATETRTYDAGGRLTKKTYSRADTATVSYTYNAAGQRLSMTDATGTTTYTYDTAGRLSSTDDGSANTVSYGYDPAGLLTKLTYPGGQAVTYSYDPAQQLTSATDWAGHTTSFGYNADGNLTSQQDPNGVTESWTLNPTGAPTAITLTDGTTGLASFNYAYDAANEMSSDTDILGNTRSYSYDPHAQLSAATITDSTGAQTNYSYAASPGGQITATDTAALTYNSTGQLSTATSTGAPGSTTAYGYDTDGNRISAQTGTDPTVNYTYNTTGSLTSANTGSGATVTYTYNGDSLRQTRQVGSAAATDFTWATIHNLPVILDDGTNRYIYGPTDTPIAQINDADGSIQYLHPDGAGNIAAITDTTGTVVGQTTYDPYGATTHHDGTATSNYGFAGEWTDPATGFVYLRARDYDPITGQFLTIDPAIDETQQPYAYANNNPLSNSDPSGLCSGFWCDTGSLFDGIANTITGGTLNQVINLLDPGATCQLTQNGFYLAGSILGVAAAAIATGGTSALAEGSELGLSEVGTSVFADTGPPTVGDLADTSFARVDQLDAVGAAETATGAVPRFITNAAGDTLDTTRITIPEGKFGYLLKGSSKSGVFSDSMGFDQSSLDSALRSHLVDNFGGASESVPMTGGGTKFTVRGPITGPSGQTWNITTAWGVDPDGTIRLITATP